MNYSASNKAKKRMALVLKCSGDYWYKYGKGSIYTVYEPDAGEKEVTSAGGLGTFLLSDVYLIPTFTEVAQAIEDGKDILVFDKDSFSFKACDGTSIELKKIYKIVENEPIPTGGGILNLKPEKSYVDNLPMYNIDYLVKLENGNIYKVIFYSTRGYICVADYDGITTLDEIELRNKHKWKVVYKQ